MKTCALPPVGTIVTEFQRDTLDFGPRRIEILPFWLIRGHPRAASRLISCRVSSSGGRA